MDSFILSARLNQFAAAFLIGRTSWRGTIGTALGIILLIRRRLRRGMSLSDLPGARAPLEAPLHQQHYET
ncbi:MAG: hypothetical protein WA441_06160 [Methyloceanibacter sp.]